MSDQEYPSMHGRGVGQHHKTKRFHDQPHTDKALTPAFHPSTRQGYDAALLPLNEPAVWGQCNTAMDWQQDESDKFGSNSSHAISFVMVDAPSGGTTSAMSGFAIAQSRSSGAYSLGSCSHQTSEEASEQGQQAYYSPPRISGVQPCDDAAAMLSESLILTPQDHQWILPDLGIQEPQFNAHQAYPAAYGSVFSPEFPEKCYLNSDCESNTIEMSFIAPETQDGPWNQTALRAPHYVPSDAAFDPLSPDPETDSQFSRRSNARPLQKKSSSHSFKATSELGRGKQPINQQWEHTVIEKGGLMIVNEGGPGPENHGRRGGRRKPLPEEVKKKVARVRKVGACWPCWLLKMPCSEGKVCSRCLNRCSKKSPLADQYCFRTGFIDFEETFFPDYLHIHLDKSKIKTLIDEHSKGFIGEGLHVEVSTGFVFEPLKLEAHFFMPNGSESELLKQHHLIVETEVPKSMLLCRYSAPVGLMALSVSDVKKLLREHVEHMIANQQYPEQTTAGDMTSIPLFILQEVQKYRAAKESSLLRNALMLHAIHYFMGSIVTFTPDSAARVSDHSQHYIVLPEPFRSSRLLNRQLKFVMHRLHREVTREVLEEFEKYVRSRTKDTWGPLFATILVLCLCIEGLQTAADTFVICDQIKEGNKSGFKREQSRTACEDVESFPFEKCTRLFHDVFRTKKEGNGRAREGGFNPFRALEAGVEIGLDPAADGMVRSIYGLVSEYSDVLQEMSQRLALLNYGYNVDPKDIKTNNNGRLAAKFLISFFAKEP